MDKKQLCAHKKTHTKENSYILYDAKSIPVSRVCHICLHDVMEGFDPAIFDEAEYMDVVNEHIWPEESDLY